MVPEEPHQFSFQLWLWIQQKAFSSRTRRVWRMNYYIFIQAILCRFIRDFDRWRFIWMSENNQIHIAIRKNSMKQSKKNLLFCSKYWENKIIKNLRLASVSWAETAAGTSFLAPQGRRPPLEVFVLPSASREKVCQHQWFY